MTALTTRRAHIAVATVAVFTAAACGGGDDTSTSAPAPAEEPTAASAEESPRCAVGDVDGDLNLYNWSEYIDPDLKDAFTAEFGVAINESNYDSNEAMQPIISAGNSGYDVIVPSDYMVSIMIESGDLMALDKAAVPNLANLSPEFASGLPYDSAGEYSVPYQWGTTGLAIDLAVAGDDVPETWGLVFDAALAEQYGVSGSITLLNDPRETLGAALKYLGYSLNTTDETQLAEATQLIADATERIAAFDSDQYDELLATGETALAHGYSGNFLVQFDEADDPDQYAYFVPQEGGVRWVDNLAIVADAPHPCTAHTFINFILDAENGAALTNWTYYASPNAAAEPLIDPEILEDPIVYPTDRSTLEFIADTGDFEINFSDAFIEAKG